MALLELCWKVKKTSSFLDRCKVYTVPVSIYSHTYTKLRVKVFAKLIDRNQMKLMIMLKC